jgi:hypothetical protein
MDNARIYFPIIYVELTRALTESWCQDITASITRILELLARLDFSAYQAAAGRKQAMFQKSRFDNRKLWASFVRQAARNDPSIDMQAKLADIQKVFSVMPPVIEVGQAGMPSRSHPVTTNQSLGIR